MDTCVCQTTLARLRLELRYNIFLHLDVTALNMNVSSSQEPAGTQTRISIATALRDVVKQGYGVTQLRADVLSGLTVGVVAVPLAMALAVASGVPPQHGLYTSIVAGALIALCGGSRFNVSGPTAAFIVILLPVVHQYGLGGLLVTTVLAGILLVTMGLLGLGRLIQYIPYPVTTGFTAGIAVVIACLQLKDFLGLAITEQTADFARNVVLIGQALPTVNGYDAVIGTLTLTILLLWRRFTTVIPGHLVALLAASTLAWLLTQLVSDFHVATIGSRFSYNLDGTVGHGIPQSPPSFMWPWQYPDASGRPVGFSFAMLQELMPTAITIAMLGAIESLLCAVVADGLTGQRHDPNAELVGQGIGNIVAPFFGGITSTAAIARTATNIRSGAQSPIAAVVHALFVLAAVVVLADLLAYVPMAALSAMLLVVAWNMSEAGHFINITRVAPRSDVAVLLTCFALTVLFNMVLAVAVGIVLAALLFIKRMTEITGVTLVASGERERSDTLPPEIAVYDINGPMFFGAAEKAARVLHRVNKNVRVVILDMADVPMIDMTGIVALDSLIKNLNQHQVGVVISALTPRIYRKLLRAGLQKGRGPLAFCSTTQKAHAAALEMLSAPSRSST